MGDSITYGNLTIFPGDPLPPNFDTRLRVIIEVPTFLVGSVGNVLVLLAVLLSKNLHTPTSVFIVNLAIADLIAILSLPLFITGDLVTIYTPALQTMCLATLLIAHTCVSASLYTIAAIAINRFLLICGPSRIYMAVYQRKVFVVWTVVIWTLSVAFPVIPPIAFDIGKLGFDAFHRCISLTEYHSSRTYEAIFLLGFIPAPCIIIVVAYLGIFIKLGFHDRRWKDRSNDSVPSSPTTDFSGGFTLKTPDGKQGPEGSKPRISRLQIQVTKNMFLVVLCLFILVTPHLICTLLDYDRCSWRTYTAPFVVVNNAVNSFIYGFKHPLFREVFASFFKCRPILQPSAFATAISGKLSFFRPSAGSS